MRRLLLLVPDLEAGGAEHVVTILAKHLPRDRFEVGLALLRRSGPFLKQIPDDVPVFELGIRRARYLRAPLSRLVGEFRPDVLLSTLGYLNLALALMRSALPARLRVILREANTLSAQTRSQRFGPLWRIAYRWLYPRADAILCNSHAMLDDLETSFGIPRSKLRYLRNPVEVESLLRGGRQPAPFRGAGPHVVSVGRLSAQKGFDRLLEAFARVGRGELWVLGEGEERARLEARAARADLHGRIHLVGRVEDPAPWLCHAHAFAMASRFEGMPNALLEALACGTPCVAFDVPGGIRELLANRHGCALIPDGDTQGLARAIEALAVSGIRSELPVEFRLERSVAAYADVLDEA